MRFFAKVKQSGLCFDDIIAFQKEKVKRSYDSFVQKYGGFLYGNFFVMILE